MSTANSNSIQNKQLYLSTSYFMSGYVHNKNALVCEGTGYLSKQQHECCQEKNCPPEKFYPRTKFFSNRVEKICPTLKILSA